MATVCDKGLWDFEFRYKEGSEKMRLFNGHGVCVIGVSGGKDIGALDLDTNTCIGRSGGSLIHDGDRIIHNASYCRDGIERTQS